MPRLLPALVLFMLIFTGCAKNSDGTWKAPLVYRIDVQQGNVVDQSMINKLRPGMDKKQVKFIMGTPLITDTFHKDRWDYLYSYEPGRGEREQRRVTLYFKDEKLDRVEGDIKVSDKPRSDEIMPEERSVAVPLEEDKPGLFKRMFAKDKKEATAGTTEHTITESGMEETTTEGGEQEGKGGEPTAKTEATPATATAATAGAKDAGKQPDTESTAGNTQEKNLVRRLWDRMTKSKIETEVDEESEQTRRDAEVMEGVDTQIDP